MVSTIHLKYLNARLYAKVATLHLEGQGIVVLGVQLAIRKTCASLHKQKWIVLVQ